MPLAFWAALIFLLAEKFQRDHRRYLNDGYGFRLLAIDGTLLNLPKVCPSRCVCARSNISFPAFGRAPSSPTSSTLVARAAVQGAMRGAHGEETMETKNSNYFLADEISTVHRGTMIALPPHEWTAFPTMFGEPRRAQNRFMSVTRSSSNTAGTFIF
jgi:hypothetical protein